MPILALRGRCSCYLHIVISAITRGIVYMVREITAREVFRGAASFNKGSLCRRTHTHTHTLYTLHRSEDFMMAKLEAQKINGTLATFTTVTGADFYGRIVRREENVCTLYLLIYLHRIIRGVGVSACVFEGVRSEAK